MKRNTVFIVFILACRWLYPQNNSDTSFWSDAGKFGISFSQVGLSNWASGGDASVSFNGLFIYGINYKKGPHLWITRLDAGYGAQKLGRNGESFRKTDDKVILSTRYGYRINRKWYTSALAEFRTQFYRGYSYDNDTTVFISGFMAPAYSKIGLGISFNHNFSKDEFFSFTFAPLNGKATFVLDDTLSARGDFGVDPGKKSLFQAGVDLSVTFNKEILENITVTTSLGLFSKYSDLTTTDVNWDMLIWFRINEYIAANISCQLIYDEDVTIIDQEGNPVNSLVQLKEVLGLGFTVSF